MLGLDLLLLRGKAFFKLLELFETFLLLVQVLSLDSSDLLLPSFAFLGACQLLFLPRDDIVGTGEKSFDFFLVCVLNGSLHAIVLLILAVQVEDHLRELGDLL